MAMKDTITLKIDAAYDSGSISDDQIRYYSLGGRDIQTGSDGSKYLNFVGVVRKGDHILVSLPKHYMKIDKFNKLKYNQKLLNIKLIMRSIDRFNRNPEYRTFVNKENMQSDFAVDAFYRIYGYYQSYGLYHEDSQHITKGFKGKVSWKKTLKKSQKLIGGGNLIFSPFYITEKQTNENLITETMIFAINYTIQLFGEFIDMPDNSAIATRGINLSILQNKDRIINQLNNLRSRIFKDIDNELIINLITFLRQVNKNSYDSNHAFIKQYVYATLWEKAVEKYLNYHFTGITDGKLNYTLTANYNTQRFSKLVENGYDLSHPANTLEPDHYWKDSKNDVQYIFDSKYYVNVNGLNHKQLVYHFMFKNRAARTYDALIMPEEEKTYTEVHAKLNDNWLPAPDHGIEILLNHLNTQNVLNCFVNE